MDIQILTNLGLDPKSASVYLNTLELGPTTIKKIAARTSLPRSTTYLLIDDLKKYNLVTESKVGKKTIFTASPPEKLIDIAKEFKERSSETLSRIISLMHKM